MQKTNTIVLDMRNFITNLKKFLEFANNSQEIK